MHLQYLEQNLQFRTNYNKLLDLCTIFLFLECVGKQKGRFAHVSTTVFIENVTVV